MKAQQNKGEKVTGGLMMFCIEIIFCMWLLYNFYLFHSKIDSIIYLVIFPVWLFLQFDVKDNNLEDGESNCRALVEIKGKNILEGLCKLGREGFIKFPLPKHLTSVTSLSQNSFTIKDKN